MVIAFMAAGLLGGTSAVGCALLLDLPILLIVAAYPAGGVAFVLAVAAMALAAPRPRTVLLRAPQRG